MNHTVPSRKKLVIFDVEGVLLPKNRYLIFELGRTLNVLQFIKLLFIGFLYEIRILPLESVLRRIFRLFRGSNVEKLLNTFKKVPLLPKTEAVFDKLREKGIETALISSGLPQIVVEDLATKLEADHFFGLELETNNGVLTGNIGGDVIKKKGKALVMKKILEQRNLTKGDCAVVADDRNNAPIFCPGTLKIGYNPDSLITLKADYVVKEDLMEIVTIIEEQERPHHRLSSSEAIRETIHATGFFVALAAMHFGTHLVAFLLSLTALTYALCELARIERRKIPIISSITLNAASLQERYEFATAPIFLALGITLALLLFPTPLNYASVAIVSLGDSAASIFGRVFGRTPIPFNKAKNLEGSFAGFVFAFFGAMFFLSPLQAFIGAMVGVIVEALPLPINDNISTPLVTGTFLTLAT